MKKPYKILVVDDEKAIINICQRYLTMQGHDILTASNGVEGFEKYLKQKPDLVLTDFNMPDINGLELCDKIREIYTETKLCIMSGGGYGKDFYDILKKKDISFLPKPYDLSELDNFIRKRLSEIEKMFD